MRQLLIEKYIKPSNTEVGHGFFIERWYDKYGYCNSSMGQPASIWHGDGQIRYQDWYKKGTYHRDKGLPAIIEYEDGKITSQHWHKNGKEIKRESY